jgi:hypothetical protein
MAVTASAAFRPSLCAEPAAILAVSEAVGRKYGPRLIGAIEGWALQDAETCLSGIYPDC